MLSLHVRNERQLTPETDSSNADRMAWLQWVQRSQKSYSNLIEQDEVDPQIERHMVLACVNRYITDVDAGKTTLAKPTNTLRERQRQSVRRSSIIQSLKQQETQPAEFSSLHKREETYQEDCEVEPSCTPPLPVARITTSMVLDYQEGIWQTIQLERQGHLPPPPGHVKKRFVENSSDAPTDKFESFGSKLDKERAKKVANTQCPVCSSAAPLLEEVFHCDTCGSFASAELMRSLVHYH